MSAADAIIVGAGVAGLAAATRLAEAGAHVVVLEAAPLPGGRARSWTDPATGDVIDNGQHLLMGCYRETLALLGRIGTRDLVVFQDRLNVELRGRDGEGGAIDCPPLPGTYSLLAGLLGYAGLTPADKITLLRVIGDVRRRRDDSPHDESAEFYLRRLGQTDRARRNFWNPLILATLNETPGIASARTFRTVLEVGLLGGAEASRLGWARVGLGDLYVPASAAYIAERGGHLRTSAPVAALQVTPSGASATLRSGETLRASSLVLAVPPAALARLLPATLTSSTRLASLPALRTSPIVSVNLWLDRAISEKPFVGLLGTTMQWLFNRSRLSGVEPRGAAQHAALVVSGARREIALGEDDLVRAAIDDLRAVFPTARRARLVRSLVVKERDATVSPAVGWDALRPGTRTAERRIFLAGDWTATGLPATIESAAASGHRAAEAVIETL